MTKPIKPKYPLFLRDVDEIDTLKNNSSKGYSVVTVEDNFNIEAKPNTFYDIKNSEDDEINITFVDEEFYANTVANEFVFNINSPANISFDKEIKWNNDNAPDLSKGGIYNISIVNGVGCYTFVNS